MAILIDLLLGMEERSIVQIANYCNYHTLKSLKCSAIVICMITLASKLVASVFLAMKSL